jgi:putative ABC transport system permease protein
MFRNYVVTALRNMERNWLYAAISILGLAAAFTAAILIAQFVRNEFSYDRWIPGYQQVYELTDLYKSPDQAPMTSDLTQTSVAHQMKAALPGVTAARLMEASPPLRYRPSDPGVDERNFAWADPDIFKVFPLPALAGDLRSALQQPDTVVITRRMARKYFGRDLPIGDFLQVQAATPTAGNPPQSAGGAPWHALRVTAVLKDLPSNTNLTTEIFASARSAYSDLTLLDARPNLGMYAYTFVRLPPKQGNADLERILPDVSKPEQATFRRFTPGSAYAFHALPLAQVHLTPADLTAATVKPAGSRAIAYAIGGVGGLIVVVAAINFVTLMTARAARRAMEVGVRKAVGASRRDLMIQFIGEAMIQVGLSALIAASLAEVLIKPFSVFVQRGLTLDFVHDPALLGAVVLAVAVIGIVAAIYPAVVQSGFRPATVLKGGALQVSGSTIARQALVVIQFAILIGLIAATATLYRQTKYALNRGLGTVDSNLVLNVVTRCNNAFPEEVRKLPGVTGAACSSDLALNTPNAKVLVTVKMGSSKPIDFDEAPVDFGFLELYGVKPLAGRLFSRAHGEDELSPETLADPQSKAMPTVIINETGAHVLGYADARAAVGKEMISTRYRAGAKPGEPTSVTAPSRIIGVVPDVSVKVQTASDPTFYFVWPQQFNNLTIKLRRRDVQSTVKSIALAWNQVNGSQPMIERFLSQARLSLYLDLIIQGVTIGICALLAVLLACLGLFALSAYAAERRTKEIGVRKAMGADTRDVMILLLWQFTVPVLLASAVAIPTGFLIMNWWLRGFVYHVDLLPWTFVLAAAAALAIAWLTVSYQSFMVARAKPAHALRYE